MPGEPTRDDVTDDARGRNDATDEAPDDVATSPELSATPSDALVDEPLAIVLTGLHPDQRATVTATFDDRKTRWRCEATFEADDAGTVDLTEQAPVDGDFSGVRPMGLVQFARPVESAAGEGEKTADDEATGDVPADAHRLCLTATVDDTLMAETSVVRRPSSSDVERVELDPGTDGVVGELYLPAGDGPHPGVVALHGSGGSPEVRFAKALASRGFAALALQYVGDPEPISDHLAEVPISYVDRAVECLQRHDAVASDTIGILGVSRGTEAAFLTAARRDDVDAVVAYTPSAYVWPGRGADGGNPPAWTVDGDPLPPVPHPDAEVAPAETDDGLRFRPIFEACVDHASADELATAALPFDDVDADVLLVSGRDDGVWHADEMAATAAERLRDGTAGAVVHRCYDAFGHHAAPPYVPTTDRTVVTPPDGPPVVHGGTPAGIADAEADAWQAVLDVFGHGLGVDDDR